METTVLTRAERIAFITDRDGPDCHICQKPFAKPEDITIDHFHPLSKGGGWEIENLKLAHQRCNAIKGDRLPNPDGTMPVIKIESRSKTKAEKRSGRPALCGKCENGRMLGPQESCNVCGSSAQPERWPRWAKVKPSECDHDEFWCWCCACGLIDRKQVIQSLTEE